MKFGIAPDAHHWGKFKRRFWGDYIRRLPFDQGDGWSADLAKAQSAIIAVSFNQSSLGAAATLEGMK